MKLFPGSIAVVALGVLGAPKAHGQLIDWINSSSSNTSWDQPLNWTTTDNRNIVPGPSNPVVILPGYTASRDDDSSDFIFIHQGGPRNITIQTDNNQSILGLELSADFIGLSEGKTGTVNLNFNSGSTLTIGTEGMLVTGLATVNFRGNLTMASGTLSVGTDAGLAGAAFGAGTVNFQSGTMNLDSSSTTSLIVGDGETGVFNQNNSTVVNAGQNFLVGSGTTAKGTYSLNSSATLNIGNFNNPQTGAYFAVIGASGGTGVLNISSNSTLNALNAGTQLVVGSGTGSVGIVNQSGSSQVNIGGDLFSIGNDGSGTYNLDGGTLSVSSAAFTLGTGDSGAGVINQSKGTMTTSQTTSFAIGNGGSGTLNLSGGNATFKGNLPQVGFNSGFVVGNGSTGTINQSGGTLTVSGAVATFGVGVDGIGNYNLSGGTGNFQQGIVLNSTSAITQSGGTLNITVGKSLNLASSTSSYDLSGGTLSVGSKVVGASVVGGLTGSGNFIFGGGTLQAAAGSTAPLAFNLAATLRGGTVSTLDAAGAVINMNSNLSGNGGLNIAGGNAVNYLGTMTYTGETDISGGTLNTSFQNIQKSNSLNIFSGTLNVSLASGGNTFKHSVYNAGLMNVNFATAGDTLVISGPVNSPGKISLGANGTQGNLQIFNGTFGDITDNGLGSSVTIGTAGSGQTGVVNFIGAHNYTGSTTVNAGYTANFSNINTTLQGDVVNAGELILGNAPAFGAAAQTTTLTMNQNLTSTGTLNVRTATAGVNDFYQVNQSATLSGQVRPYLINGLGGPNQIVTFNILSATTGVTIGGNGVLNDAGGLTTTPNTALYTYGLTLDAATNTLQLNISQGSMTSFAQNANQLSVARLLDTSTGQLTPLLGLLPATDGAFISSALQQLSQPAIQYDRSVAYENSAFMVQTVNGAMSNMRAGYTGLDTSAVNVLRPGFNTGMGRSLLAYNSPAFHQTAPNGVNYYPAGDSSSPSAAPMSSAPSALAPISETSGQTISDSPVQNNIPMKTSPNQSLRESRFSGFIGGDVILADMNQSVPGSYDASYTAGDVVGGIGFRATSNFTAGVLFDYNHTDVTTDSYGSKTTVNTFSPGLFATFFQDGFYVNGLFTVGFSDYSHKQNLPAFGTTASGSPSGMQFVTNLDLGYDFHPAKGWTIGPTLGGTWTSFSEDAYQETGAGPANLNIDGQSGNSVRSRLGGHVVYEALVGNVILRPNMAMMWQHEYADTSATITGSFADPLTPGTLSLTTPGMGRDSALISAGLNAELTNSMAIYLNYMADVGNDDFFAQSVMAGFKGSF